MMEWSVPFDQFIGGRWSRGRAGTVLVDRDPFTGETVAEIPQASLDDLDEAYASAERAQGAWARSLPSERHRLFSSFLDVLERRRDEIVDWLVREAGSTRLKAEMEWRAVRAQAIEASSLAYRMTGKILPGDVPGKENRVYREPLGVIGVISPWNWPLSLSNRSVAAAVALGNTVVLKPADDTPITGGLLLARLYEEAGLPAGVLNVVVGAVDVIGDAFTLHDVPRFVSFTGSTAVGRRIARLAAESRRLKGVALELGGNAPLVVLDDADLDRAVDAAVYGRFLHAGQICMSTNRIIVDRTLHADFAAAFRTRVAALRVGDPSDPSTVIGPLINRRQLDRLVRGIEAAHEAGYDCLLAGRPEGLVLPPHVFAAVPADAELARAEQFGPVVALIRAENEDHALRLAEDTEYGLSSAVFTRDLERGVAFARRMRVGLTHVNDATVHSAANCPFGGEKNSGLGRFGGEWILEEFTTDHLVTVQSTPRTYPF